MKLKFPSTQITERTITGKASGKAFTFREQEALVHFPDGQVRKILVRLEDGQGAYTVGEWIVGDMSFTVDKYNALALGRLALTPVVVSAATGSLKTA